MKTTILLSIPVFLIFFGMAIPHNAQWEDSPYSESEIEKYAQSIDKLKSGHKLKKIPYPNMSSCGGGLAGYYLNEKLVLIDATYRAELGYSSQTFYIDQDRFLKIIYREHFAEWEKYAQNYPSDEFKFDESKMTYADTVYIITLTNPAIFRKQAGNKVISSETDAVLIEELVNCGLEMKSELNEVINDHKSPNH